MAERALTAPPWRPHAYNATQTCAFEHFSASGVTLAAVVRTGTGTGHPMEDGVVVLKYGDNVVVHLRDVASAKAGFTSLEANLLVDACFEQAMAEAVRQSGRGADLARIQRSMHTLQRQEVERRTHGGLLAKCLAASALLRLENVNAERASIAASAVGDVTVSVLRRRVRWFAAPRYELEHVLTGQRDANGQPSQLIGFYQHAKPTVLPHSAHFKLKPGETALAWSDGALAAGLCGADVADIVGAIGSRWDVLGAANRLLEQARLCQSEQAQRDGHGLLDDQALVLLHRERG